MNVRGAFSFSILACVLLLSVPAFAATPPAPPAPPSPPSPPGPPPGPPPKPPTASEKMEDHYKNIQSFKGYPADQLIPAMQFISAALGVECEFCHVDRAPEKDDKEEKQAARKMIAMTAAINRDNFKGKREVTCNSCHRGSPRPLATPAVATEEPAHEAESAEAEEPKLPSAEALLDKYLQAIGGAEALAQATSRIQKGNLTGLGGPPLPIEIHAKAPDKRISILHTPRGDSITAFDGHEGWLGNTGRPPREMSAAEAEAARQDADFRFASHAKKSFQSFRVTSADKIDGHDTVRVVGRNEGAPPVELWFDAQSGLLLRLIRYAETPLGRNPTQVDYGDYRDAGGVKIPFHWTVARPSGRFSIQIDSVEPNAAIEDSKFEKPAGS